MAEDLFGVLARFHREIVGPDIERIVERAIDGRVVPLREDMLANFDALFKALERLENEYQSISGALHRFEERIGSVEQKIEKLALRSELVELKERVHALEQRISQLEAQ